jgi:N-acetylglucosaminyl-diphospho-decaprenol L-rhamnosyltransferase
VNQLLEDLGRHCGTAVSLVLTRNVEEPEHFAAGHLGPPAEVIVNAAPKGFGANHNAAFARCRSPYFCVANPDIRLGADPFPALVDAVADQRSGVAGPRVLAPDGGVEDSARRFPTPGTLIGKLFGGRRGPDYPTDRGTIAVDWVAGMFMLFRSDAFAAVKGFDEAYFLYYEDADICRRLRAAERSVLYVPAAEVVHDARRASRRDPRLALHHAASAWRFMLRS